MSKQHAPAFLKLVQDAKSRIRECTVQDVKQRQDHGNRMNCPEQDAVQTGQKRVYIAAVEFAHADAHEGHADGRLTIEDPATGRQIELQAFWHTNALAFSKLLASSSQDY